MTNQKEFNVVILGAGAAGFMCAIEAGKRGLPAVILEHNAKPGGKILISGGGRCNFTNTGASPDQFVSQNPHFVKSALARYSPEDFISLVRSHKIAFHEKKLGQLFCDVSARDILDMLLAESEKMKASVLLNQNVVTVQKTENGFQTQTENDTYQSKSLVVATGGLSIPKMGASDLGYRLARQFDLKIVQTAPALDGFTFTKEDAGRFDGLSGISADTIVTCDGVSFRENILITHVGLSGPAALQASLYWHEGLPIEINFAPSFTAPRWEEWWMEAKTRTPRSEMHTLLGNHLPQRLAQRLSDLYFSGPTRIDHVNNALLKQFAQSLQAFPLTPKGTVGYTKAEVTRGGVDTTELSSKTMESKKVPGLYFIGEVVDVTGWLGGYNFQWAWASGFAAGQSVS